jgi:hypothetical protein
VKVFLSYDDTQRDLAARLALAIRALGHQVFFDQDSLPAGTSYDDRIRSAILRSHLFVFLISSESVRQGAYALTELGVAEQRWPHPTGRVLPVLVDDTAISSLPAYLRAVSVLKPRGDLVGDTVNAVAKLGKELRSKLVRRVALPAVSVAGLAAALWLAGRPRNAGTSDTNNGGEQLVTRRDNDSVADLVGEETNAHVYTLKNKRHVRLVGEIVANESNVASNIVRDAVEFSAWRYNRCYDASFGHLASDLPEGGVVVRFEILDQLPRHARVERSDFTDASFNECIVGTVTGQTVNAAGPNGAGLVLYSFRFLPN